MATQINFKLTSHCQKLDGNSNWPQIDLNISSVIRWLLYQQLDKSNILNSYSIHTQIPSNSIQSNIFSPKMNFLKRTSNEFQIPSISLNLAEWCVYQILLIYIYYSNSNPTQTELDTCPRSTDHPSLWPYEPEIIAMWVKQCHKPPMTGNAKQATYKNGDDWGLAE